MALSLGFVACGSGQVISSEAPPAADVAVPDGFAVDEVIAGLNGPTQIDVLADGRLLIAHLNGAENEGVGQVLAVEPVGGAQREVWFSGLDKPTGVVVVDDEVWIMERRRLSRGPVGGGKLVVVLDDLPYNGRSEGTLSTTADGRVLYNTSGRKAGRTVEVGSGQLLAIDPDSLEVEIIATGFKHAYARTLGPDATLWQTEMSDGTFDGSPAPDELVAVQVGDDFGWPRCVGDRRAVAQFGGDQQVCAATPRSHALFATGATPTSVAIAPWDDAVLLVALWNEGRIVSLPAVADGDSLVAASDFLVGVDHPQHLLSVGTDLYISDYGDGRILKVSRGS